MEIKKIIIEGKEYIQLTPAPEDVDFFNQLNDANADIFLKSKTKDGYNVTSIVIGIGLKEAPIIKDEKITVEVVNGAIYFKTQNEDGVLEVESIPGIEKVKDHLYKLVLSDTPSLDFNEGDLSGAFNEGLNPIVEETENVTP